MQFPLRVLAAVLFLAIAASVLYLAYDFSSANIAGDSLSDEQQAEVIRTALADPRVQEGIAGHNYTVSSVGSYVSETWYPVHIRMVRPEVQFLMPERGQYLVAVVDARSMKVTEVFGDVIPLVPSSSP